MRLSRKLGGRHLLLMNRASQCLHKRVDLTATCITHLTLVASTLSCLEDMLITIRQVVPPCFSVRSIPAADDFMHETAMIVNLAIVALS